AHQVILARKGRRKNKVGRKFLAAPGGPNNGSEEAGDGDFGCIDDRSEILPADAAQAGDGKATALHVGRAELAVPRLGREFAHFLGDNQHAFLIGVLENRDDQSVWRISGEADVVIALVDEALSIERGIELWKLLERRDASLD